MSAATSYAKALFEAAQESGRAESPLTLENEMDHIRSVVFNSKELRVVLLGPVTTSKEKSSITEELCNRLNVSPLSNKFAVLLARKGRLELLEQIQDAFSLIRLAAEGSVAGRLVAAEPISDSDISILAKAFGKKLGKKVAFRVSIDPSLLAGMKVTVNGVTYDGTLRSQLQKLRDSFASGISSANV